MTTIWNKLLTNQLFGQHQSMKKCWVIFPMSRAKKQKKIWKLVYNGRTLHDCALWSTYNWNFSFWRILFGLLTINTKNFSAIGCHNLYTFWSFFTFSYFVFILWICLHSPHWDKKVCENSKQFEQICVVKSCGKFKLPYFVLT